MDNVREILRDEIHDIIKLSGSYFVSKYLDDTGYILHISNKKDYNYATLNDIDNGPRYMLSFTDSNIIMNVIHNNTYTTLKIFAYEDPDLLDQLLLHLQKLGICSDV